MDSDKFRELEKSLDSDPYNIYVEDQNDQDDYLEENGLKNIKGSNHGVFQSIVDSFISRHSDKQDKNKSLDSVSTGTGSVIVTTSSDITVSKSSTHSSADVIYNYMDVDNELKNDREDISEEVSAERELKSVNVSGDCTSFFNCFNAENSVNKVIACEDNETITYKSVSNKMITDVSSSYLFDKDPNMIRSVNDDPFAEYDTLGYEDDSNKHKRQKNINRLGMAALSTAVVMGSAWIHAMFND